MRRKTLFNVYRALPVILLLAGVVTFESTLALEPRAVTAVGLMQDTDIIGGKVISELRLLEWQTR